MDKEVIAALVDSHISSLGASAAGEDLVSASDRLMTSSWSSLGVWTLSQTFSMMMTWVFQVWVADDSSNSKDEIHLDSLV